VKTFLPLLAAAAVALAPGTAGAAEPFLKPNDVIALVGGEDMVAASEYGYLELLLQRALPDYKLKFRCLAWEGDTVFEQPRELNYPTLEAQLDEIGATVVIMQFGQMESLAGSSKLPEFIRAYEKLIERVSVGGKRRVVVHRPDHLDLRAHPHAMMQHSLKGAAITRDNFEAYRDAITKIPQWEGDSPVVFGPRDGKYTTRDSIHVNDLGSWAEARRLGYLLERSDQRSVSFQAKRENIPNDLLAAIRAKNRLWFHYYRPQNWAFLNGDRTEQPSSRDHKDPSKRWFPEEMKQFLSLVEAKEKEIWDLAAKSAQKPAQK